MYNVFISFNSGWFAINCNWKSFQFELTEDIGDIFKIRIGIVEPPKEEDEQEKGKGKKDDKKKKDKKKAEGKSKKDAEENKPKMYSWYLEQVNHFLNDCTE